MCAGINGYYIEMGNALVGDVRQCKSGTRRKDLKEHKRTTSKDGNGDVYFANTPPSMNEPSEGAKWQKSLRG